MKGAMWILVFVIITGIMLYIGELRWRRKNRISGEAGSGDAAISNDTGLSEEATEAGEALLPNVSDESGETAGETAEECCGLHLVCEKDSLSPMSDDIIYYDDEELDRFVGRSHDSYTPEEEDEFREVLMTLRPEDVAGWARSVTQRRLELPADVRDELLMLVNEQRGH
ncbi:MAG: phospholipase [Muribaculaceae bacterium]|nr:phospholipase [Muribaculaceae bacterium]